MKHIVAWTACAVILAGAEICLGELRIQGYDPNRHDRFATGPDRDFIGEAYDWSGVGGTNAAGNPWVTMISPSYFLTCTHWPAGSQSGVVLVDPVLGYPHFLPPFVEEVTFHEDNDAGDPAKTHTYEVDPTGWQLGGSDVWVGKLKTPLDPVHNIATYPVLALPSEDDYLGMEIFVYGRVHRLGRNVIDRFKTLFYDASITSRGYEYDYDLGAAGLGDDEAFLYFGDSGASSFAVYNGQLAALGTHSWFYENPDISGDAFYAHYLDEMIAVLAAGGESPATIVPEPATTGMLVAGLAAVTLLRRRRRA